MARLPFGFTERILFAIRPEPVKGLKPPWLN